MPKLRRSDEKIRKYARSYLNSRRWRAENGQVNMAKHDRRVALGKKLCEAEGFRHSKVLKKEPNPTTCDGSFRVAGGSGVPPGDNDRVDHLQSHSRRNMPVALARQPQHLSAERQPSGSVTTRSSLCVAGGSGAVNKPPPVLPGIPKRRVTSALMLRGVQLGLLQNHCRTFDHSLLPDSVKPIVPNEPGAIAAIHYITKISETQNIGIQGACSQLVHMIEEAASTL
ncbi:hypothetical protein HGRIS_004264 [Hohenbuehelia grisea]|uniref:Uncharacterized protein n=1 Tax=Hohenbuehelia grisea TaxID=104357 RepID=A0ABR3IP95_9AGAR